MKKSRVKRSLVLSCCLLWAVVLMNCGSTPKTFPPESFVVTGTMNPVSGSKVIKNDACWVLEAGANLRQLQYYQLVGEKEMVDKLKEADMVVTIRVVSRPTVTTNCQVGAVAEVLEILEMRSKKN